MDRAELSVTLLASVRDELEVRELNRGGRFVRVIRG